MKTVSRFALTILSILLVLIQCQLGTWAKPETKSLERPIKDKWAVVIGVSKFADHSINLRYPAKDARDFYQYLTKEGKFAPDHVLLLTDENATRLRILSALGDKWLPHLANPDDLVVIYISSHGSPADIDVGGLNYIIAHDTSLDCLYGTAIPLQDLMRIIKDRVHSNRIVLILDACHSGAATTESKGLFRSGNVNASEMASGTGQLVIASSKPNQVSWEGKTYQNSVFTYHLINALKSNQNAITLGEAFEAMKDSIQEEVLRDRGKLQTPEMKSQWEGDQLILSAIPTRPRFGMKEVIPTLAKGTATAINKDPTVIAALPHVALPEANRNSSIFEIENRPTIPPVTILDNGNIYKVFNQPSQDTVFSCSYPSMLIYIFTYHWNNGKGAKPGTIALKHEDGTIYGPWQTKGKSGQGKVKNAYWECEPIVKLKQGTYKIIDSDPSTWAQNTGSRGAGFARVRVAPLVETKDVVTQKTIKRSPEAVVFTNNNIYGVLNNPRIKTAFSVPVPTLITQITNYHWNGGRGKTPGKIALLHRDGTLYGPWQSNGRSGQDGAPEVYWDCMIDVVIKPGTYTVEDSDRASWSQNQQSSGCGISNIQGVYQD